MTVSSRLLLVDQEPGIARAMSSVGYHVRETTDGRPALAYVSEWKPHLVVTELSLPGMDGRELCRRIRDVAKMPIIVVSANGAEPAKVEALDSGADDYVTKPVGVAELLARVRAALRRAGHDVNEETTALDVGDFRIDLATRRIHVRDSDVRLTPKEFDLFVYFARRPNRVLEHRRLLEAVWGPSSCDHAEYLRVFVSQLRKKLEREPSVPRYLTTEAWVGYRFTPSAT